MFDLGVQHLVAVNHGRTGVLGEPERNVQSFRYDRRLLHILEGLARFMREDTERWQKVITGAGIKAD